MKNNKTAFITGATSGIGASFAKRFAHDGYNLIITGRRREKIQSLADELSAKYNVVVEVIIAELSDIKVIKSLARIISGKENIEILVNNAGFGIDKVFNEDEIQNQENMITVHIIAAMNFVHAVIPQMIHNGNGTIINVSSLASFLSLPKAVVYCGTKAFLNKFSESIYIHLKNKGIQVQCLCPGFTRSDFHQRPGIQSEKLKNKRTIRWMTSDEVVNSSMKCLSKQKVICIPGFWNKVLLSLTNILPRKLYYSLHNLKKTAGKR